MKGFFTQGAALLLKKQVPLEEFAALLAPFGAARRIPGAQDWALGEETLMMDLDPGPGHLAVDVVRQPWPDDLGDPHHTPMVFAAWSTGSFGPCAFPRGFERACQQAWIWPEAQREKPAHQAFVRLRTTYTFGKTPNEAALPEKYNPQHELQLLTRVAAALARHEAVVCYFNSSGEVVLPPERLHESLAWAQESGFPPIDAWTNVRFFKLSGEAEGWFLMDTVGNWQLDLPDHEVFLPGQKYDFKEAEGFLRNLSLYLLQNGQVFRDGDTIEGPGEIHWRAKKHEESFTAPPRQVLRWFAEDGQEPPSQLRTTRPQDT